MCFVPTTQICGSAAEKRQEWMLHTVPQDRLLWTLSFFVYCGL